MKMMRLVRGDDPWAPCAPQKTDASAHAQGRVSRRVRFSAAIIGHAYGASRLLCPDQMVWREEAPHRLSGAGLP